MKPLLLLCLLAVCSGCMKHSMHGVTMVIDPECKPQVAMSGCDTSTEPPVCAIVKVKYKPECASIVAKPEKK